MFKSALFLLLCMFSLPLHALEAEITTHLGDHKVFQKDEQFRLLYSLSEASYVLVVYETAGDGLIQLYPNRLHQAEKIQSSWYSPLYSEDEVYHFRVSPPYGPEAVWLFASNSPIGMPEKRADAGSYYILAENLVGLTQRLQKQASEKSAELVIAHTRLKTQP
jgi:hypothetical protein